jgi:catalase (peroxidase I)
VLPFDRNDPTSGGADGSLQFETHWPENLVVKDVIEDVVMKARRFNVSVADTLMLASRMSIEACQGPRSLDTFRFGRVDATAANRRPPPLLINATMQETVDAFMIRFGFTAEETVALIGGGHTIALSRRASTAILDKPLDSTPHLFDTVYFQELLEGNVSLKKGITHLESDINLLSHGEMKSAIEKFATQDGAFRQVFLSTYERMSVLGSTFDDDRAFPASPYPVDWSLYSSNEQCRVDGKATTTTEGNAVPTAPPQPTQSSNNAGYNHAEFYLLAAILMISKLK